MSLAPVPSAASTVSALPGANVLIIGPSGAGKTTAIKTLIAAGITPFCVFTEPGFEVLGDIPADKLHWRYIPPASVGWDSMLDMSSKVRTYSFKSLTEVSDPNKSKFTQFEDLLRALNNYKCERDGKTYGDVCLWNTDRALVVDSLTGVNIMAMALAVGGKPVRSQADWGIAQNIIENLVQKLCTDTRCHMVLMAHAEREVDEVLGGSKVMASTLGKKLAPKLPRFFSDVVLAVKEGTVFSWSTAAVKKKIKARNLPISDNLKPDFGPIITSWKSKGGTLQPSPVPKEG